MELRAKQRIDLGVAPGEKRPAGERDVPPKVVVLAAGETFEVDDEVEASRLVAIGAAEDPTAEPPTASDASGAEDPDPAAERLDSIAAAILVLNPENPELWNQDGTPKVGAVREAADDGTISADEVKAAHALVQARDEDPDEDPEGDEG